MEYTQYANFIKPSWAPPSFLFGPVWTFLYIIIAISFGFVFYKVYKKQLPTKYLWPFVINLLSNFAFTPLQFGLENNLLAAVDITIVLVTIIWIIKLMWNKHRWVALAQLPYLAWVSFATVLQFTITYLNW